MKEQWEAEAYEAMDEFIAAIKEELGEQATVTRGGPTTKLAEIELALLRNQQALMSKTMQALADDQDFPPDRAE